MDRDNRRALCSHSSLCENIVDLLFTAIYQIVVKSRSKVKHDFYVDYIVRIEFELGKVKRTNNR